MVARLQLFIARPTPAGKKTFLFLSTFYSQQSIPFITAAFTSSCIYSPLYLHRIVQLSDLSVEQRHLRSVVTPPAGP